jgi:hypothetical protein
LKEAQTPVKTSNLNVSYLTVTTALKKNIVSVLRKGMVIWAGGICYHVILPLGRLRQDCEFEASLRYT